MKNVIYEARKDAHLTQAETAKYLGISKRSLEEWEAGNRNPKSGYDVIAKKIRILGILTREGREALLTGELSWKEATSQYRISEAKKLSKYGRYLDTFNSCLTRIPTCVVEKLDGSELAVLIDAIKNVYDEGCSRQNEI